MSEVNPKLNELVNALQGIYQPIYGHSEWDKKAQRDCQERLPEVKKIYDALSAKLQRPLRVLDLGACHGYFCFHISSWGGVVTGVDSSKQFLEVCECLASEHPDFKIKFIHMGIQKFIPTIKEGEYDLVLVFSMLHWVTQQSGFQATQKLLTDLAEKVPVGLFELARTTEFPDLKLPKSYRDYLKGYTFVRVLKYCNWGENRNSQRPFCFASKKYVYFDDLGILKIDKVVGAWRKHFQCGDKFIKVVPPNVFEWGQNELKFLQELGGKNGLPKLHTFVQEDDETGKRMFIIRDNIKGILLAEKISSTNEVSDRWNIVEQILRWMIFLEKHGYYHADLHPGNFIYKEDGKIIPIDYDLMIHKPISHRWPYNFRLTIFNMINTILEKKDFDECHFNVNNRLKYYSNGHGLTDFSKHVSEDKYRRILALNDDEKFFENLYEILFSTPKLRPARTIAEVDILEKEQYLRDLGNVTMSQEKLINSLNQTVSGQQKRIEQLEGVVKKFNETMSPEKSITPLTQKLSEQQKRIEQLEGVVKQFNETMSPEKLINSLNQTVSGQQKRIEQLEGVVKKFNETMSPEKSITPLTQKLSEQQKRIEQLEGVVKQFNETMSPEKSITPLTQKLSEQQKRIEQLEGVVKKFNETMSPEKSITPLTQKLSEQQKRIEQLEGVVKQFNETMSPEKSITPLTQKLSEQQKRIEQLEDLVAKFNERFNRFFAADYD